MRRIDDDGAGRFAAAVADDLALQPRIKLRVVNLVSRSGLCDLRRDLSWSGQEAKSGSALATLHVNAAAAAIAANVTDLDMTPSSVHPPVFNQENDRTG